MQTQSVISHSIDPRGQSPARFPNQVINNRDCAIVVSAIEIMILIPIGHDIRADEGIRLPRPFQRTLSGITQTLLLERNTTALAI